MPCGHEHRIVWCCTQRSTFLRFRRCLTDPNMAERTSKSDGRRFESCRGCHQIQNSLEHVASVSKSRAPDWFREHRIRPKCLTGIDFVFIQVIFRDNSDRLLERCAEGGLPLQWSVRCLDQVSYTEDYLRQDGRLHRASHIAS